MVVKGKGYVVGEPGSILLVQLGDIGDVVLSLPCIRALREHFPRAPLALAVRDKAATLFDDCPWVDDVIAIGTPPHGLVASLRHQMEFLRRLRSFRCELAMDLRTGTRGAIMAWLSGARQRIGFHARGETFWRNWLFTDLYRPEPVPKIHMTDYLQNFLTAYGIGVRHTVPELPVADARQVAVQRLLREAGVAAGMPVVAVQPFSLWRYKEVPRTTIVEVLRFLRQKNLAVVVVGSAGERERAEALVRESGPGASNLAGKTNLLELAALLQSSALFIGVDSAGLHLAAAVGAPTVGIFGPSAAHCWAPRGERHLVVQKDLPCVPCHQKGCDGSEHSRCLDALTVEEITAAVTRQFEGVAGCRATGSAC
ncbi:MAG: glycosyltransferase family 9 protein [Thermodesulfobacteriota bacterium]